MATPKLNKKQGGVTAPKIHMMDFYDALRLVGAGKKITRLSWGNPEIWLELFDGFLMIIGTEPDDLYHPLNVSVGDMAGLDWVVKD